MWEAYSSFICKAIRVKRIKQFNWEIPGFYLFVSPGFSFVHPVTCKNHREFKFTVCVLVTLILLVAWNKCGMLLLSTWSPVRYWFSCSEILQYQWGRKSETEVWPRPNMMSESLTEIELDTGFLSPKCLIPVIKMCYFLELWNWRLPY